MADGPTQQNGASRERPDEEGKVQPEGTGKHPSFAELTTLFDVVLRVIDLVVRR